MTSLPPSDREVQIASDVFICRLSTPGDADFPEPPPPPPDWRDGPSFPWRPMLLAALGLLALIALFFFHWRTPEPLFPQGSLREVGEGSDGRDAGQFSPVSEARSYQPRTSS